MALGQVRTTLSLPSQLLEAVDKIVKQGGARSRNELLTEALRHELALREREAIDAEFAEMARDVAAGAEAHELASEFARSDWEAFQEAEQRQ